MRTAESGGLPVLYSFRRCPYAMRARLAIRYSGTAVELREVLLRDMPASLVAISPKRTVPVLVLPNGQVLDESWDIIQWALRQADPDGWTGEGGCYLAAALPLVEENDTCFKADLDHYKYASRYPEHPPAYYRARAEKFLAMLEPRLAATGWLLGETLSVADIAIFPFIRQFAMVDMNWFEQSPYGALRAWLSRLLASDLFLSVMQKYPVWEAGSRPVIFSPGLPGHSCPTGP